MKSCRIKIIRKLDFWISSFEAMHVELKGWKHMADGIACQRCPWMGAEVGLGYSLWHTDCASLEFIVLSPGTSHLEGHMEENIHV